MHVAPSPPLRLVNTGASEPCPRGYCLVGGASAGVKAATQAAKYADAEKGKLDYQQIVQLVNEGLKESKKGAPPLTLTALLGKKTGTGKESERLVELLLRTQQTELLKRLLHDACSAGDDLLLEVISKGFTPAFIKFVYEGTFVSDAARSAWSQGLTLAAAQRQQSLLDASSAAAAAAAGTAGAAAAPALAPALSKTDLLAWHALAHADTKVLALVLRSPTLDPAVVLADGSNLLHEAVDRQDVLVSAEHMSVLLQVLRQRMRPEDFMGDLQAEQLPRDLAFIEHNTPDGLTVLYKVVDAFEKLQLAEAERRKRKKAEEEQQAKQKKGERRKQEKEEAWQRRKAQAEQRRRQALAERRAEAGGGGFQQVVEEDTSSSSEEGTDSEEEDVERAAEKLRLEQLMFQQEVDSDSSSSSSSSDGSDSDTSGSGSDVEVLDSSGASSSQAAAAAIAATAAAAASSSSSSVALLPPPSPSPSQKAAGAAGSSKAKASSNKAPEAATDTEQIARASYAVKVARWIRMAEVLLAAGADPLSPVAPQAAGFAGQLLQGFRSMFQGNSATAFERLVLFEPKDHKKYTDQEFKKINQVWEERQKRKAEKRNRKPGKQEVKGTKAQEERGPTNPMIYPEYQPKDDSLDQLMLRAALRSLAIKAGTTDGAVDKLKQLLPSKPKVCSYLERTFVTREKNRPDVRKLKTQEVWAGVTESFAVTMMRYHTKQQALLKPFIRASEPAMTAATPWANMLWLGLAAPPNVLHMLLHECNNGSRGNPIACEYSTGGNFLHALLQYRPLDTVLLDRVLHTLAQDKHSKARALNHVHRVTQQTPLSMALATQQASMVQQLLLAGADPLVQCLHTRLVRPSPAAHGAASSSSDAWQAVPWRTTVLHMLLGESAGLVLGPVPWPEFLELQQLCLQVAEQLAKSEKHEAVLNTRVNEDGEGVLFAAARYCCTTGNALPLQELTTAGADWVQPNRHGVSPLLLLKRHTAKGRHLPRAVEEGLLDGCWKQKWTRQMLLEVIPTKLHGWDVQLLLQYLDALPWNTMLPLLCDVSLHVALIRDQRNLPMARLLLDKAAWQLSLAAAAAAGARSRLGASSISSQAAPDAAEYAHLSKKLFSDVLCHDYVAKLTPEVLSGMIKLGLRTDKVNGEQQPLLHAALANRCSTAIAMLLLNNTAPEVMLHEDASHTYPLHYVAALPDLHEPERMELLKAACNRCFATRQVTEALLRRDYHDRLPHQIPAAAAARDVLRLYHRKAKKWLSAESDAAAGAAADAAADEDVDEEDEDEAEDAAVAAAQGQAAIQAASEAASDGITGSTSAHHMIELLLQLPDSQRAAEDAAAASGKGRQQNEEWSKLNERLSRVVVDAAAGKLLQYRRGDDKYQQLHAELVQLGEELPQLQDMVLSDRTWEITLTRDALEHIAALKHPLRRVVAARLSKLADGNWRLQQPGQQQQQPPPASTERHDLAARAAERRQLHSSAFGSQDSFQGLMVRLADVRAYSMAFMAVGRVVFEVCPEYSDKYGCWVDTLRIWGVTLTEQEHGECLDRIISSYSRADDVLEGVVYLRPILNEATARLSNGNGASGCGCGLTEQDPLYYEELPQLDADASHESMPIAFAQRRPQPSVGRDSDGRRAAGIVRVAPPASANQREFTMLRLIDLTDAVMQKLLSPEGLDVRYEDVPFRLSRTERKILKLLRQGSAILLMGRSGTGKTTCIVYGMFEAYMAARQQTPRPEPYRGVFVTASPTLKEQVQAAFSKLQMAVLSPSDVAKVVVARNQQFHSFRDVPDEAFPLFLSSKQWLSMLDATVPEPFLRHRDPATLALLDEEEAAEQHALEVLLDEDAREADADAQEAAPTGASNGVTAARQHSRSSDGGGPRQRELTFALFEGMWKHKYERERKDPSKLDPKLIYQEFMSLIRGSAEAVSSPAGYLSLDEYLALGRKRSANTDEDVKRQIYGLLQTYQTAKAARGLYDRADLVHSLYTRLGRHGYQGVPISHVVRDEVQDFVQGELLLDVLVLGPQHAANVMYCGDTAQTITRGVGFRFTDVKSMLIKQYEVLRAQHKEVTVSEPELLALDVNYRSHAGILDVGNAIVSVTRHLSPLTIDRLPREHAFFDGPRPLLLGKMTAADVAMLTAGRRGRNKQIEFGAHQVILVRSTSEEGLAVLPEKVRHSNALKMEVLQAKGLEFEDVLVCDFLSSLADNAREWRVLLTYLRSLEEHPVALEEARQMAAQAAHFGGAGSSFLQSGQWLQKQQGSSKRHMPRRLFEDVTLTAADKASLIAAQFDPHQHASLVENLKLLYVAVTRAKANLAFFESNQLARAALYFYLRRLGLAVEVKTSLVYAQDCQLSNNLTSNTPADWVDRGMNLLQQQDWPVAAHCFAQAKDWLRHAACKANHMLYSKSGQDHEAAVLLVEAAAGAARRHKQLTTGGSDGLTPITAEDYTAWLHTAALVFEQRVDRQEAVALYCQIQKYDKVPVLEGRLRADADKLGTAAQELLRAQGLSQAATEQASQLAQQLQRSMREQYAAVSAVVAAAAKAKASMPAAQPAGSPAKQPPQQAAAAAQAAAVAAAAVAAAARVDAARLHAACQQLLSYSLDGRQLLKQAAVLMSGEAGQEGLAASSSTRSTISFRTGGDVLIEDFMAQQAARAAKEQQEEEQRQRQAKLEAHAQRQARIENAKREAALQQELLAAQQLEAQARQQQQRAPDEPQQQQEQAAAPEGPSQQQQHEDEDAESVFSSVAASGVSEDAGAAAEQEQQQEPERELPDDAQLRLLHCRSDDGDFAPAAGSAASSMSNLSAAGPSEGSLPAAAAGTQEAALVCSKCGLQGHTEKQCQTQHCDACSKWGHTEADCAAACGKCGALGHAEAECSVPKCRRCTKHGHTVDACPMPKGMFRQFASVSRRPASAPRPDSAPAAGGAAAAAEDSGSGGGTPAAAVQPAATPKPAQQPAPRFEPPKPFEERMREERERRAAAEQRQRELQERREQTRLRRMQQQQQQQQQQVAAPPVFMQPPAVPFGAPVAAPIAVPVAAPVAAPVVAPVAAPVVAPVAAPVFAPVAAPVVAPVAAPVAAPTAVPVAAPVAAPAPAPVAAVPAAAIAHTQLEEQQLAAANTAAAAAAAPPAALPAVANASATQSAAHAALPPHLRMLLGFNRGAPAAAAAAAAPAAAAAARQPASVAPAAAPVAAPVAAPSPPTAAGKAAAAEPSGPRTPTEAARAAHAEASDTSTAAPAAAVPAGVSSSLSNGAPSGGGHSPRPGSAGSTGSYLASTEVLNRALKAKCQELAAEQKGRREAEAQAAGLAAQVQQLQAQLAELSRQWEADRAEIAALKQQLVAGLGSGRQ